MKSTIIRFPVVSFRHVENPYDLKGKKTYVAVVNVKDISEDLEEWRKNINPRDPNVESGVAQKIRQTLLDKPESFFFRNRGITLIVTNASFNNKTNFLDLEMVEGSKNGLLDGGHTFRVIRDFIGKLPKEELADFEAFVRLEILQGIEDTDEAVDIVESRNTSTQVKDQTIEELRKHFETIKKVLEGQSYSNRIAYKEYELTDEGAMKDIDIKEILSYLVCFDAEEFDRKSHPIKTYSSKVAVLEHFKKNREEMLKYVPLLPVILELKDTIYLDLPEAYNGTGGKFGNLTGVIKTDGKPRMQSTLLPFIGKESNYRIPSGFIYPILAGFRALIQIKNKQASWKADPIKIFNELKEDLAERVCEQALQHKNPNKLGKDNAAWRMCYDSVESEILRRSL